MLRPTMTNNSLSTLFRDFEKNFFRDDDYAGAFQTDVIDKGDSYLLQAELPGFNKEDINVELKNGYLTVTAKHNEENKEEKENYIRQERRYGSYQRSFYVGEIDQSTITAEYKNGVLELSFPKETDTPTSVARIEVK